MVAAELAADVSDRLVDLVELSSERRRLSRSEEAAVGRVEEHASELIAAYRSERRQLAADAREVFRLLGRIPVVLRWDEALKYDLNALILAAVHEAERFGKGTGPKKRRFAIELIVRVIERYNYHGIPFLPSIEKAFVNPIVGVAIDWSVAVLNLHGIWPPVNRITFPSIFQGTYGPLFRMAFMVASAFLWARKWLMFPTKYEREVRRSLRTMEPQVRNLLATLPPNRLHGVLEELGDIVVQLGNATAPYVGLIDEVLRLTNEVTDLTPAERNEAAFRMLRRLLLEAYADDELALTFIDSALGDYLLWAIVNQTTWVLARNGLLPDPRPRQRGG